MKLNSIVIVSALFMSVLMSSCGDNAAEAQAVEAPKEQKVMAVKVMKLHKTEVDRTVEYAASLQAYEKVDLAPSIPGQIEKIYVEIGDRVKKGDLIVLMDETSLKQAELELKNLEADYKRYDTVQKVGALSKQLFETTETNKNISRVQVANLKENTRIVAPFDGVITAKYFEDREIYSGSPTSADGKPAIVTIMQIDKLKAYLDISESYYMQTEQGMKLDFHINAIPNKTFDGKILRKYPTIDEASRTFTVEAVLPNTSYELRPGMYSKMSLYLGKEEVYLVPYLAVLKQQGSNERYVFVYENGKAVRKIVTIGKQVNDYVEVLSDEIDSASQIIYSGHVSLKTGDKVRIANK